MPHLWPTCSSGVPPNRLQPDTSPQALRIPDRSGHPALRVTLSKWLQVRLVCIQLSPSCPIRLRHTFLPSRPARNYPRLWIQRPSSERRGDFNPHDSRAAQRTLWRSLTPYVRASSATAPRLPDAGQIGNMPVVGRGVSRFPCKELPHMPVSSTTPGRLGARDIAPIRVAFR